MSFYACVRSWMCSAYVSLSFFLLRGHWDNATGAKLASDPLLIFQTDFFSEEQSTKRFVTCSVVHKSKALMSSAAQKYEPALDSLGSNLFLLVTKLALGWKNVFAPIAMTYFFPTWKCKISPSIVTSSIFSFTISPKRKDLKNILDFAGFEPGPDLIKLIKLPEN